MMAGPLGFYYSHTQRRRDRLAAALVGAALGVAASGVAFLWTLS